MGATDGRLFGWTRDAPDERDHPYVVPVALSARLPALVDLRPQCPQVLRQGLINACTAHVLANAHLFDQKRQRVRSSFLPSRLFIYWNERVALGMQSEDSGATIRGGIKAIGRLGACPETLWAYDSGLVFKQPHALCFAAAQPHRAVSYRRISRDAKQLCACLAEGWPFAFGFSTFEEFHSAEVAGSGVLPMPPTGATPIGGHAVLAVGYDESARTFLAMNSWGPGWGQAGYFTIPWDYLLQKDWAHDFWTVRAVSDGGYIDGRTVAHPAT